MAKLLNHSLKEYDPKQVIVTWSGIPLNSGIADGTFVTVSRNKPLWVLHKGGDGEGARVRASDNSGTIAVTMRNGSEVHQIISALALTDLITGVAVAPLLVIDMSGRTLHTANRAFIHNYPDDSFGTSEETRTWIFQCDGLLMFPGGSRDVTTAPSRVGFTGSDFA